MYQPTGKDQPLRCSVEGDELVIRIGVDTLAHAAERVLDARYYKFRIVDNAQLTRDVVGVLDCDAAPLRTLLDTAIVEAFKAGSVAFEEMGE